MDEQALSPGRDYQSFPEPPRGTEVSLFLVLHLKRDVRHVVQKATTPRTQLISDRRFLGGERREGRQKRKKNSREDLMSAKGPCVCVILSAPGGHPLRPPSDGPVFRSGAALLTSPFTPE